MKAKRKTTCKSCPHSRTCHDRGGCYSDNPCDFAVAFDKKDRKIQKLKDQLEELTLLTEALELINAFVFREYGDRPYTLQEARTIPLGIAYTSTDDDAEHPDGRPIKVNVDLKSNAILRYIDDVLVERIQYPSLRELIVDELMCLDFDALALYEEYEIEYVDHQKMKQHVLDTVDAILSYCKLDGYELYFKADHLHYKDDDCHFVGKDVFLFITEDVLCFEESGALSDGCFVPERILVPYIKLSITNGVIPGQKNN